MATEVVVMLRSHSRIRCLNSNGNGNWGKNGGAGVLLVMVVEWYSKVWTNQGGFKHDKQQRHGVLERERTFVCVHHSNKINTVW
jgi:hypothetical protein